MAEKKVVGLEKKVFSVSLEGASDIMFDKFIDHSKERRPAEQKLYLTGENVVVLPAENIYSFMFAENPPGCVCKFEGKKKREYLGVGQSHVFIDPVLIPFNNGKGEQVAFSGFGSNQKKFYITEIPGRTKQGSLSIKQEAKPRPTMTLPWSLSFRLTLLKNDLIDETKLENWFRAGGTVIALGTFRPRYGRFFVTQWDET